MTPVAPGDSLPIDGDVSEAIIYVPTDNTTWYMNKPNRDLLVTFLTHSLMGNFSYNFYLNFSVDPQNFELIKWLIFKLLSFFFLI